MDPHIAKALVFFIAGSLSKFQADGAEQVGDAKVRYLENYFWKFTLREFPEYATRFEEHDYDDRLNSYTMEAFDRRNKICESLLEEIYKVDLSFVSPVAARDLFVLESTLQTFVDGYMWKEYGNINPINFLEVPIKIPSWVINGKYETEGDFKRFFARLSAIPKQIDEQIALMNTSVRLMRTNHILSMKDVPQILKSVMIPAEMSGFLSPFVEKSAKNDIPSAKWSSLKNEAIDIIDKKIYGGYSKLAKFIQHEYIPASRHLEGVSSLESGMDYYRACLKWYLGKNMEPLEIHDLGLREVKRIEKDMIKVMKTLSFNGTIRNFFDHLKTIPRFYNFTETKLLNMYDDIIGNRIEPVMFSLFRNITLDPVSVMPMMTNGPRGFYGRNTFYVNLFEAEKRSTFTMMPLTLHETNPGHHFQVSYARTTDIPSYRRDRLYGGFHSVPYLFPTHTAFSEGWALYAEDLGMELGLYDDPYDLFGKYSSEIFRACRLVVDTGIHAFGWSHGQAVAYLANYTDFPHSQLESEVTRYITWPGQACAYKIGEMKLKELRQNAEAILGDKFDIKEFHHEILRHGNISLDLLKKIIDEWIKYILTPADTRTISGKPVSSDACHRHSSWSLCVLTIPFIFHNSDWKHFNFRLFI